MKCDALLFQIQLQRFLFLLFRLLLRLSQYDRSPDAVVGKAAPAPAEPAKHSQGKPECPGEHGDAIKENVDREYPALGKCGLRSVLKPPKEIIVGPVPHDPHLWAA